jgi:hypothetical protein
VSCISIVSSEILHPANCVISISNNARIASFSAWFGTRTNRIRHKNAGAARNNRLGPHLIGPETSFSGEIPNIGLLSLDAERYGLTDPSTGSSVKACKRFVD